MRSASRLAEHVVGVLTGRGQTLAVAESLTGGLVAAAITDVAGSSAVFEGGVVAYSHVAKERLLGVDPALLRARGAVNAPVARAMSVGVRQALATHWAIATTGVAGPDPSDGQRVGTVWISIAGPRDVLHRATLAGDRHQIRQQSVRRALEMFEACLE